jgi:tRNA(Ile)-lysidine synthetase-like protein
LAEGAAGGTVLTYSIPDGRVLVAVSGGPDSTALLLAARESGRDIVAAHYDHALSDGSDQVARQVADLCSRLGVRLVSERRITPVPKGSLQAAARRLRYEFLERARVGAGAEVVALAHTADDVAEGVVLHLLRGCGLAGFRGMPARRARYVRPLLNVWRKDVREFLEERGVVPYEDPANLDPRFARARVRHLILPALERDRPGIVRRLHAAAAAATRLQDAVSRQAAGEPTRTRLRELPEPVAAEALKALYVRAGGADPGLSRAHITAMLRLSGHGRGGRGVDLPGGLRFRIVGELMQVVRAQPVTAQSPRLEVKPCAGCDDRGAAHLRAGLQLRVGFRIPGLRMRPLGGQGTRKLQDLFVDARVPREDRDGWPLVFAGDRLAWVPGVAVDADLAGRQGELGTHVALTPMPANSARKVVRLENPNRPLGDLS